MDELFLQPMEYMVYEKWIESRDDNDVKRSDVHCKHYRSSQKILLVGEGDFSFSLCLARAFGSAVNIVATSLDSREYLVRKYRFASINLTELKDLGCTILHKVDVGNMVLHEHLKDKKLDRIIFNFPHAGFYYHEFHKRQIRLHRRLVRGFLQNGKEMLTCREQIHITHKTTYPYSEWHIEDLAENVGLFFNEGVEFQQSFYPGYYYNKRGDGSKCDKSFPIGWSSTFKFSCNEYYRY
ncbi:uncharacterized protein At4g26485-like [Trifolium pratense]|uniref:uncharacterized protein At4g26485-like n=1 Tax=Trifolium pratense TaxID=57577 RepID=UPI001E690387|nr:uncharacterized protein At4g26485-like [Trifolium pratense]